MGYCCLCEKNKMYWNYLCDDCLEIQKIVKLYGAETVINTFKVCDDHAKKRLTRNLADVTFKKTSAQ